MYSIEIFDKQTGDITFKVRLSNGDSRMTKINILPNRNNLNLSDYRQKPNRGYINRDNGNIEIVGTLFGIDNPDRPIPPPLIYNNETKYTLATQYDYDKWSNEHFPECDNAKIFRLLNNFSNM